jgi:hypothetical protein
VICVGAWTPPRKTTLCTLLIFVLVVIIVVVVVVVPLALFRGSHFLDPRTLRRLVLLGALDRAAVALEAVVAAAYLLGAEGVGEGVVAAGGGEVGRGVS